MQLSREKFTQLFPGKLGPREGGEGGREGGRERGREGREKARAGGREGASEAKTHGNAAFFKGTKSDVTSETNTEVTSETKQKSQARQNRSHKRPLFPRRSHSCPAKVCVCVFVCVWVCVVVVAAAVVVVVVKPLGSGEVRLV